MSPVWKHLLESTTLKLIRAHLGRTGGPWHQSIQVSAKMTPCHSWRALTLMSVSSSWEALRASLLTMLGSPPSAFWQTAPQEQERHQIWHLSLTLQIFSHSSSFAPNQDPNPNFLVLFSFLLCLSSPRSSQLLRRTERRAFHEAAWVGACICFSVGACIISFFTSPFPVHPLLASVSFFFLSPTADEN